MPSTPCPPLRRGGARCAITSPPAGALGTHVAKAAPPHTTTPLHTTTAVHGRTATTLHARCTRAVRLSVATCVTVLIAGCGAEIVHVRGTGLSPNGPFAPPAGHVSARPSALPSSSPNAVIHFITGGGGPTTTAPSIGAQQPFPAPLVLDPDLCRGTSVTFPTDLMLTPDDVWSDAPNNAQAGMALDFPVACAFDQPAVPIFDCTIGFPWYTATQTSVALANIGVVQLDLDTLIHGQQGVTEYLLYLGGNAATDLTHMASACDPPQSDQDAVNGIFRATTTHGVTTSLLHITDNRAVALVFHGFPEGTKDFLFALAVSRAGLP